MSSSKLCIYISLKGCHGEWSASGGSVGINCSNALVRSEGWAGCLGAAKDLHVGASLLSEAYWPLTSNPHCCSGRTGYPVLFFAQLGCFGCYANPLGILILCTRRQSSVPRGAFTIFLSRICMKFWPHWNKKKLLSTKDNAKMDIQMHIKVDIHGNPDGYLRSAGGRAWLFFGCCVNEKEEFPSSFSFASFELSVGSRTDPAKTPCGHNCCYNKKKDGGSKPIGTKQHLQKLQWIQLFNNQMWF